MEIIKKTNNEKTFTSLFLVEQINEFRNLEGNRSMLLHKSLLTKIESEFAEEITEQKILPSKYKDKSGKENKMYELTYEQSLQLLMSESKAVRKGVIEVLKAQQKRIEELQQPQTPAEIMLQQAQILVEQEQKLNQIDERLKDVENRKNIYLKKVMSLPEPENCEIPELSDRSVLNKYIRNVARVAGVEYRVVWDKLYSEWDMRYKMNVKLRALNKNISPIDYIDSMGKINELYFLAKQIYKL